MISPRPFHLLPQVKGDRGYCLLDINDGAFYNRDLLLRLLAADISVESALKLSRGEELVSTIEEAVSWGVVK